MLAEIGEVIRVTPSARMSLGVIRHRARLGVGAPIVICKRDDGGWQIRIPTPDDRAALRLTYSHGECVAVRHSEIDYFRGSIISFNHDSLYGERIWWMSITDDTSPCGNSDPLGASCCPKKFSRLQPELFGCRGWIRQPFLSPADREALIARTSDFLHFGDSRAAIVLSQSPLIVAAYCDEMDASILLRFPSFLVEEYNLEIGSRLVTANLHSDEGDRIASDISPGPNYRHQFNNLRPLIADFLARETDQVKARSRSIADAEYQRCMELGEKSLIARRPIRSGRPLETGQPRRR